MERPFQKKGSFQRDAVASEAADDLHAERQAVPSVSPGTLTHGVPSSVHSRLKVGSPVEPSPCGAAPGADGVRIDVDVGHQCRQTPGARGVATRRASS